MLQEVKDTAIIINKTMICIVTKDFYGGKMIKSENMLPSNIEDEFLYLINELNECFYDSIDKEILDTYVGDNLIYQDPNFFIKMIHPQYMPHLLRTEGMQSALYDERREINDSDDEYKEPELLISIINKLNIEGYGDELLDNLSALAGEFNRESARDIIKHSESTISYRLPENKGIMRRLKDDLKNGRFSCLFAIMNNVNKNKSLSYRQSMDLIEDILPGEFVTKSFKYMINMIPEMVIGYAMTLPQVQKSFINESKEDKYHIFEDLMYLIQNFESQEQKEILNNLPKSYLKKSEVSSIIDYRFLHKTITYDIRDCELNTMKSNDNYRQTDNSRKSININNYDIRLKTRGSQNAEKANFSFTSI